MSPQSWPNQCSALLVSGVRIRRLTGISGGAFVSDHGYGFSITIKSPGAQMLTTQLIHSCWIGSHACKSFSIDQRIDLILFLRAFRSISRAVLDFVASSLELLRSVVSSLNNVLHRGIHGSRQVPDIVGHLPLVKSRRHDSPSRWRPAAGGI